MGYNCMGGLSLWNLNRVTLRNLNRVTHDSRLSTALWTHPQEPIAYAREAWRTCSVDWHATNRASLRAHRGLRFGLAVITRGSPRNPAMISPSLPNAVVSLLAAHSLPALMASRGEGARKAALAPKRIASSLSWMHGRIEEVETRSSALSSRLAGAAGGPRVPAIVR